MRKIFFLSVLGVGMLLNHEAAGQQDAQFSQYMFNTLFYNPAFAGVDGFTKFSLFHRSQWAGYRATFDEGTAPTTQVASMSTPIFALNSGFGAHIVNDNLGPQNNLEIQASYAYHLALNDAKLSFGIRLGAFAQSFNFDRYRPREEDDPLLEGRGRESQVRPDMAVGVYFRKEKYYAGLSFNHLLRSEFDFGLAEQRNPLEPHMILTAGYIHEVNFDLSISPSFIVKSDLKTYSFDVGVVGTYRERMWGGLSFRQADAAIILLGYSMLKDNSLKIGYSFDYIIKEQEAKMPTSHEIMVTYQLPVTPGVGRKIIRTPRYRH